MVPQNRFVIVAEVRPAEISALRSLLATMNLPGAHGFADPTNLLVPFREFPNIHFARFAVLADNTLADRANYPEFKQDDPTYLCFMADCDGSADALLAEVATKAQRGLKQIFSHCADFDASMDLHQWMRAHRKRPATSYVNWIGRSVIQAQEEDRLRKELRAALPTLTANDPESSLKQLRDAVRPNAPLSPIPETPFSWRVWNLVDFSTPLAVVAIVFLLFPILSLSLLVLAAACYLLMLRRHEQSDPVIPNLPEQEWIKLLRRGEDHDVTNQYGAMGSLKPGLFRKLTAYAILWIVGWTARHLYGRGNLARIATIHFAHWTLLDNSRRLYFASYYDGSHEAYMDDFINKAGFGLNLVFSNGMAYPETDWLITNGAYREQEFKAFQRRHQIPTDVWYKAYPGLTAYDLARNSRIRIGFEKTDMSSDEIRRWLAEI